MVKIKRTYAPKALSETNREFKAAIEGMSTKDAYNFYKAHKGIEELLGMRKEGNDNASIDDNLK